tara:strand:+ start:109 stop:813 length:705 start_codon:yes stop_codon:yes gene_type:complete
MLPFKKNSLFVILLFFLFSDIVINESIDSSFIQDYSEVLKMIYYENSNFFEINEKISNLKNIKDVQLTCVKNKNNIITLNLFNEKDGYYFIDSLAINDEYDIEKFFMILSINSFLFGDVKLDFTYSDFDDNDSNLFRKSKMLNHFRKNYKSLMFDKHHVLYQDSLSTFWIKSNEDESIIIGLNNSLQKKQSLLNLTDYKPNFALSLLDRSMVKFKDGKANFNLLKYQTRIFNLK